MIEDKIRSLKIQKTQELLGRFFSVSEEWQITVDEQKRFIGEGNWVDLNHRMDQQLELILTDEAMGRLVLLMSIKDDVEKMFPSSGKGLSFYRSSHDALSGMSPHQVAFKDADDGLPEVKKLTMNLLRGRRVLESSDLVFHE